MDEKCERLENCRFFQKFNADNEVITSGWILLFCDSLEKSETCARKLYFKQNNKIPPDNMSPTGTLI